MTISTSLTTSTPLILNLTWEDWAELVETDDYLSIDSYFFLHGNEEGVTLEVTDASFKCAYQYYVRSQHNLFLSYGYETNYVSNCLNSSSNRDGWYIQHLKDSYSKAVDLPYYYTSNALIVYCTQDGDDGFWGAESLNNDDYKY